MALARHRDSRTTRRYVQVDGAHLRQAVEHLVGSLASTLQEDTATALGRECNESPADFSLAVGGCLSVLLPP